MSDPKKAPRQAINLGLDFADCTLELQEYHFQIKDDPFVLVEPSGKADIAQRQFLLKGSKVRNGQLDSFENAAGAELVRLSHCLYRINKIVDKDGNSKEVRNQIPVETLETWPQRILNLLLQKVSELAGEKVDEGGDKDDDEEDGGEKDEGKKRP